MDYIKGILTFATTERVTVENGGIGYGFTVPLSTYTALPQVGKEVMLFIVTVVREDSHKSYGFLTRDQRELFERVTQVSGIGPKTGIALIGYLDPAALQAAIMQANISLISKVPGIGKKTAERLIVELRDKCKEFGKTAITPSNESGGLDHFTDAINALINLGYNVIQAQKAVKLAAAELPEGALLPQLITASLQKI